MFFKKKSPIFCYHLQFVTTIHKTSSWHLLTLTNFFLDASLGAATCWSVCGRLIIKDNKKRQVISPQSCLNHRRALHGVWVQTSSRDEQGGSHGPAARQTDMEQADRVHPGRDRLRRGFGECLEVPLSLLQERRR